MPLVPRTIACDVCRMAYQETDVNLGFPNWCIIQGIGSRAPDKGESMRVEHTQTVLCPQCRQEVSAFIDNMQKRVRSKL